MTELQFLIDILLNHKLTPATKKLVAERIGIVEQGLIPPPRVIHQGMPPRIQTALTPDIPVTAAPMVIPDAKIDKETGRAMVPTGRGTSGPRKF